MKKFISMFTAMLFMAVMLVPFTACGDDDDPVIDNGGDQNGDGNGDQNGDGNGDGNGDTVEVTINVRASADGTTVTATITPGAMVTKYSYAIGLESDEAAFEAGSLAGTETVTNPNGNSATYEFKDLEYSTEYFVFAIAEDADGNKSDVNKASALTGANVNTAPEVALTIHSAHANRVNATLTPNEHCAFYLAVLIEQYYYDYFEVENDPISFLDNYGDEFGDVFEEGVSGNFVYYPGYYEEDYYFLVLPYDSNGAPGEVIIEKMVTEAHNPATDLTPIATLHYTSTENTTVVFVACPPSPTANATAMYIGAWSGISELPNNELMDVVIYNGNFYDEYEYRENYGWTLEFGSSLSQLSGVLFLVVAVDEVNGYNSNATVFSFAEASLSGAIAANAPMQKFKSVDFKNMTLDVVNPKVVKEPTAKVKFIRTK